MNSPFLTKLQKAKCDIIRKNINLGQFKDHIISFLTTTRMIDGEIKDIEFGQPSKGCVPLEIYVTRKKEIDEDQVVAKKSGKKR